RRALRRGVGVETDVGQARAGLLRRLVFLSLRVGVGRRRAAGVARAARRAAGRTFRLGLVAHRQPDRAADAGALSFLLRDRAARSDVDVAGRLDLRAHKRGVLAGAQVDVAARLDRAAFARDGGLALEAQLGRHLLFLRRLAAFGL